MIPLESNYYGDHIQVHTATCITGVLYAAHLHQSSIVQQGNPIVMIHLNSINVQCACNRKMLTLCDSHMKR